ncbi:cupin domain-containing protein [Carnimonas nigrificans]|uniref:cupin domain-containing protein n=1 Tax=Carnimonas nigrificans TaxID=64323 RepID=UPI00046FA3D6|nr:cupin domain-containing protein [Carnimonas nigrificans]
MTGILGELTPERFLAEYWQKKPLLIRQAIPGFESPLSAEELAGLACEEEVESRLVESVGADGKPWQVTHGPMDEEIFARLPERDWTLLVQAVDHYVPEVAELLEQFSFIPRWRLDDIMISYAPPGGNVGPHVDNYDVFLLQGAGQRRWQLGGFQGEDAAIVDGISLRILKEFSISNDEEWVLEPGDMLYLPPRYAHHGISESSDCMTWSIGFRAPSADEAVTSWADYRGEQLSDAVRYADPDLGEQDSALLDDAAIERVRALILNSLDDREQMSEWFGRYMTQTKYPDQLIALEPSLDLATLRSALAEGEQLVRGQGSRFAYRPAPDGDADRATLFVDGDGIPCSLALAQQVAQGNQPLPIELLDDHGAAELLLALTNRGSLVLEESSEA